MDQKALSHLDPKARETYDRVMNTAMSTENPVQNTPAPDATQNFQADIPAAPAPIQPAQMPSAPADLTMVDAQPAPTDLSTPPSPSIFSASPVSTSAPMPVADQAPMPVADPNQLSAPQPTPITPEPVQSTSSDFFTNPVPGTPDTSAQPSPFAPLTPEPAPADTAMATDQFAPAMPVTPYTPAGQDAMPAMPQTATPQPLASPAAVATPHETSPLLKVLYIVGAVVFFAVYTIFWIKVFKLPFLF